MPNSKQEQKKSEKLQIPNNIFLKVHLQREITRIKGRHCDTFYGNGLENFM